MTATLPQPRKDSPVRSHNAPNLTITGAEDYIVPLVQKAHLFPMLMGFHCVH